MNSPKPTQPISSLLGYYAGFISRLLAFIIDAVLISFSIVAITWFINVTATMLQFRSILGISINTIVPDFKNWLDTIFGASIGSLLSFLFMAGYHIFFWMVGGQTPGKAIIGLRVIPLQGTKISFPRAILRYAGYFISVLPMFIGFFWIILDDKRQAFHDKLANTCVVYTWEARPDERFLAEEIEEITQQENGEL